jgi:hypothetical protein
MVHTGRCSFRGPDHSPRTTVGLRVTFTLHGIQRLTSTPSSNPTPTHLLFGSASPHPMPCTYDILSHTRSPRQHPTEYRWTITRLVSIPTDATLKPPTVPVSGGVTHTQSVEKYLLFLLVSVCPHQSGGWNWRTDLCGVTTTIRKSHGCPCSRPRLVSSHYSSINPGGKRTRTNFPGKVRTRRRPIPSTLGTTPDIGPVRYNVMDQNASGPAGTTVFSTRPLPCRSNVVWYSRDDQAVRFDSW